MHCCSCSRTIADKSLYCNFCGGKQQKVFTEMYSNPKGTWKVTTEGDLEGRTRRDLGIHKGYVDEIAGALASQTCYSLTFKAVLPVHIPKVKRPKQVHVTLDIDSGIWNLNVEDRARVIRNLLKDRPVHVREGNYYGSVLLVFDK